MTLNSEYFDCECFSSEHTLRYVFYRSRKNWSEDDVTIEVYLNTYEGFWKRVWIAVRYIFGYRCRYGHWDNIEMKHEDVTRLRGLLQQYESWRDDGRPQ